MERKVHPSDLTVAQWRPIAPLIPAARSGGRPRKYAMREVVNALLYLAREGCSWRVLPYDLPYWKTCYNFLRAFEADGTWAALVAALRVEVRTKLGRDPTPGACIDSQSARTALGGAESRSTAASWVVTAAYLDVGATAPLLLSRLPAAAFPRLAVVWADRKYRNSKLDAWLMGGCAWR